MGVLKIPIKFNEDEKRVLEKYLENHNTGYDNCVSKSGDSWRLYVCETDEFDFHTVTFSGDSVVVNIDGFPSCRKDSLANKIISHYRNIVDERMGVGV